MLSATGKYKDEFRQKIMQAVFPYAVSLGYEIVDLTMSKPEGKLALRFLVDKPTGGISLRECAILNERLSEFLDRENILNENYILEVSSPGVDRILRDEKDFRRICGRRIRIFLQEPIKENTEMEGIVDTIKDNFLFLKVNEKIEKIPLDKIKKAKQVIE